MRFILNAHFFDGASLRVIAKVALVEYHNMTEGRYVCANDGNCTSPGVCECAAGWSGFDCRTPICSQVVQIEICLISRHR